VSVRTVGRVMAVHRDLYGLGKPKRSPREKAEIAFRARKRHEIWTADVRYVPHSIQGFGNAYVIAVLENYSRTILASAVSLTQDTTAFLRVFYSAVERYGPPERLMTDGGGIFKAKQFEAVYRALGITKEQIERRKPYQSYIETAFGIQKRMADWLFATAETFPGLAAAHDSWREDFNAQSGTGPTKAGRTDGAAPRTSSASTPRCCATARRTSAAPSSRPAPPAYWTLWGTSGSWTGGSTARRPCPGAR
jgi:putative transposase